MVKHMLDIYDLLKKANFASESNYMSILFFQLFGKPLEKPQSSESTISILSGGELSFVSGGRNNDPEEKGTVFNSLENNKEE